MKYRSTRKSDVASLDKILKSFIDNGDLDFKTVQILVFNQLEASVLMIIENVFTC